MRTQSFRTFSRIFLVSVLAVSGTAFLGNSNVYAEVVEVEGQGATRGGGTSRSI